MNCHETSYLDMCCMKNLAQLFKYISIVHNIKGQNCPFILLHFKQSESTALQYPINIFKCLYPFET